MEARPPLRTEGAHYKSVAQSGSAKPPPKAGRGHSPPPRGFECPEGRAEPRKKRPLSVGLGATAFGAWAGNPLLQPHGHRSEQDAPFGKAKRVIS